MRPDAGAGAPVPGRSPLDSVLWAGLVLVILAVAGAGLWRLWRGAAAPPPLPVVGEIPDFRLVERSGRPVTAGSLRGAPWVADFIFTRCTGMCPVLSAAMSDLQERLARGEGGGARLVSFSVDPLHDTPEVLARYADGYRADAERWWFLTGDRDELHRLIQRGFLLSVAEAAPGQAQPGELITHSDRLVLVDARLRIRGYYHGTEADAAARIAGDLARLAAEAP